MHFDPWCAMAAVVTASEKESAKISAARAALAHLPEAGIVGLGTGSTAKHFIDGVGQLVKEGRKLVAVPTSDQSQQQARALGIPLAPVDGPWDIALTVDGADEVSCALDLIKGGGAAHTREKIVNFSSRVNIIVADESKLSQSLGEKWPVPLEVLAFAHRTTAKALKSFGNLSLREKSGIPVMTDSGNYVYDLSCGIIDSPAKLDQELRSVPGIVETGLFCARADLVLVAGKDGVRELKPSS